MSQFELDQEYKGQAISGIDEAGRGCLAGPVVVARVTWDIDSIAKEPWFHELGDSKKLTQNMREKLYPLILKQADKVRVGVISHILIDYLNILRATLHGFELVAPQHNPAVPLLIDGNQKPPTLKYAKTIVKGDSRVSAIAAAGIIAKVTRDKLMEHLATQVDGYDLAKHKGYATASHRNAIEQLGPSAFHRKSFKPSSAFIKDSMPLDETLSIIPEKPSDLLQHWQLFQENYHRCSLQVSRTVIEQLSRKGLKLLPSLLDLPKEN